MPEILGEELSGSLLRLFMVGYTEILRLGMLDQFAEGLLCSKEELLEL